MDVERRNGRRFDARFGVVFNDHSGLNFSFITNLSRSGAFLSTKHNFDIGSLVSMYISNGNYEAPIQGRVARIQRRFDAEGEGGGIGILFDQLTPAAKRLRDDLLLYLMSLKYHRQWN